MRIGVDSGGTFTDFIAWDGSRLRSHKVRSTPDNPASAILAGLSRFAASAVVHGSTVATNALLQRTGARVAFVTTRGFEDLLELARQNRADLYDWTPAPRRSLVQDGKRFGIAERVLYDGSVLEPLAESEISRLLDSLGDVEAVAVCLLHSYANPAHEQRVGAALRAAGFSVSLSSEILPEYREYERAATTVVNAYLSPLMATYLHSLEAELPQAKLRVFQSNGGSISVSEASRQAVRTVLSGPAGGLIGAAAVAWTLGIEQFISFDMGGTSTDVSLYDGTPPYTTEGSAAGLPVRVPMLDIESIGAGGGSVAYFDEGCALRVGPRSAGAVPGPVCYGTGEAGGTTGIPSDSHLVHYDPRGYAGSAFNHSHLIDSPRPEIEVDARTLTGMLEAQEQEIDFDTRVELLTDAQRWILDNAWCVLPLPVSTVQYYAFSSRLRDFAPDDWGNFYDLRRESMWLADA